MREIKTNEPTKYEVAIVNKETGEKYLLFYRMLKSRRALFQSVTDRGNEILHITGAGDEAKMELIDRKDWQLGISIVGTDWVAKYTGRTQRDVRTGEELPFICDQMPAKQTIAAAAVAAPAGQ